jgi:signal peptidase I
MLTDSAVPDVTRGRVAQVALQSLWFVAIPAALALLTLRYLVPVPVDESPENLVVAIVRIAEGNPVALGAVLFLVFAGVTRHFSADLPGARYLSPLAPALAARAGRDCLRAHPEAAELLRALTTSSVRKRIGRRLSGDALDRFEAALADLGDAFDSGDVARVSAAENSLRTVAAPSLLAEARRSGLVLTMFVVAAAAAALLGRATVAESYRVLSESMLPTFEPGDCVLGDKLAYGVRFGERRYLTRQSPRRGDIVVFPNLHPEPGAPDHLVKRVIGVPGDRISMRGAHPVINGWEVPSCDAGAYVFAEPWGDVRGRLVVEFLEGEAYLTSLTPVTSRFEHYDVRPGEVFVLGDNRNNSSDSRAWNGGTGGGVPVLALDGKVERFILGTHRDGSVDLSRFLSRLSARVHLEGVDVRPLEQGIARCLAHRPVSTAPNPGSDRAVASVR